MENLSENVEKVAPATVADDAVGMAAGDKRQWFVAVVNNRSERKVADILQQLGHEVFVPTRTEERKRGTSRTKKVERVLLPAMVFIHCTEAQRRIVVNAPWIKRFKMDQTKYTRFGGHQLMTIPHEQILSFRRALDIANDLPFDTTPFTLGEYVRIEGGEFDGLTGYVLRLPNGRKQVRIALGTLGCLKVSIPTRLLKKAPTT